MHDIFSSLLIVAVLCITMPGDGIGACLGERPIWGTGDDRASCSEKARLKKEEKQLDLLEKQKELERRKADVNNSGVGSGSGNTNVVLGGLDKLLNGDQEEGEVMRVRPFSQHQVRFEAMPYVIPGAYQLDEPGMPDRPYFNGAAWEYFLNRNFGIGILWQQWEKSGGKNFDPVMSGQRDGSGDTAVFFPGAIDRMSYQSIVAYVTINAELSDNWMSVFRIGLGHTQVDIEYSGVDYNQHPFAHQPDDDTYISTGNLMMGLAIERLTSAGTRIGGEIRYHNARNDTMDYREYYNLGAVQTILYFQVMLEPLGLL